MPNKIRKRTPKKPPEGWDGITCTGHKKNGLPCGQPAIPPTTKCHYHGGKSLRGPAHPNFLHGGRSTFAQAVPGHLRKIFLEVSKRDDIVTLRNELSILEAREINLLEQLRGGGSREFWKGARKALSEFRDESLSDAERQRSLDRVLEMVERGAEESSVWEDILDAVEVRRRLSDTERRRLEMLQAFMTPDQAMALISHLVQIIREVVDDRHQISKIIARFQALMPGTPQNQTESRIIEAEAIEA